MKGQSSFEMFVTVVTFLAATVPVVLLVLSASQLRLEDLAVFHARTTVQQLSDSINEVYLEGNGSTRTIVIELPSNTQELKVGNNMVSLYLSTSSGPYEVSHPVFANVSDFSASGSGLRAINIHAEGASVKVVVQ